MTRIEIIAVGRIKERFYSDAIAEYAKRLSAYVRFDITELKDESEGTAGILDKEGERIAAKLSDKAFKAVLAIEGKMLDSEGFSALIEEKQNSGISHIQFVIGGSEGLSDEIKHRADMLISFSRMTFPHQLMRLILSEQIYRAYRIMRHEPYHK